MAVRNACVDGGFAIEALLMNGGQVVLGHLVEMLGSNDPEAILACLQLIHAMALVSHTTKPVVVERCQSLGICDVLESLQVRFRFRVMHRPSSTPHFISSLNTFLSPTLPLSTEPSPKLSASLQMI